MPAKNDLAVADSQDRELLFSVLADSERYTFNSNHAGMQQSWSGTLDQLAVYLAALGELQ